MDNKRISTTELDFDGIKQSLKSFLKGQDNFQDYNFEGSGLSILLDVLAYNTHYNALYYNLAVNESFLDSASKRNSVVSKASALGYLPRSKRSAEAKISLAITSNISTNIDYIELPKHTLFSTIYNGASYNFYSTQPHIAYKIDRTFFFPEITLKEGTPINTTYIVSSNTQYVLANTDVDVSTITVTVQESQSSTNTETFVPSSSLLFTDGNSAVYFIKEIDNFYHQIEFGNGVVGKKLSEGNIVNINYLISSGTSANNASSFVYSGPTFFAGQTIALTTISTAVGGSDNEDIESIRQNAPKYFAAQNRLVTVNDYKSIISANFPVKSICAWGGETNIPPVYGKIFLSILSTSNNTLTNDEIDYINTEIISPRRITAITPVFVDPVVTSIILDIKFYYDSFKTSNSANKLSNLILQRIESYNNDNLSQFDSTFRESEVTRLIDSTDISIKNSLIKTKLLHKVNIIFNQSNRYYIELNNAINPVVRDVANISSAKFYAEGQESACFIEDVPYNISSGSICLFTYKGNQKANLGTIGSVSYTSGQISFDLQIAKSDSSFLEILIQPDNGDIYSKRNQVIMIDFSKSTTTAINIREA